MKNLKVLFLSLIAISAISFSACNDSDNDIKLPKDWTGEKKGANEAIVGEWKAISVAGVVANDTLIYKFTETQNWYIARSINEETGEPKYPAESVSYKINDSQLLDGWFMYNYSINDDRLTFEGPINEHYISSEEKVVIVFNRIVNETPGEPEPEPEV